MARLVQTDFSALISSWSWMSSILLRCLGTDQKTRNLTSSRPSLPPNGWMLTGSMAAATFSGPPATTLPKDSLCCLYSKPETAEVVSWHVSGPTHPRRHRRNSRKNDMLRDVRNSICEAFEIKHKLHSKSRIFHSAKQNFTCILQSE